MILERILRDKQWNAVKSVLPSISSIDKAFSKGKWKYLALASIIVSCAGYYMKPVEEPKPKPPLEVYVDVEPLDEIAEEFQEDPMFASDAIKERKQHVNHVEDIVKDIAQRWNADNYANFYLAQMYIESGFRPEVTSVDSACGVSQITKGEFDVLKRTMIRRVNKWHGTDNTFDHEWNDIKYDLDLNAEAGFVVFLYNKHKARGILDNALAMYNAGRTRIFNAMKKKKTRDLDIYQSALPRATQQETIPYVRNIRSVWSRMKSNGVEETIMDIERYNIFVANYHRFAEEARDSGDIRLAIQYWEDLSQVTSDHQTWQDKTESNIRSCYDKIKRVALVSNIDINQSTE